MTDRLAGIGVFADLLDDLSRLIRAPIMAPLVLLMIATIWIVGGCYSIFWPDKMIDANRRMGWLGRDPDTVKVIGYFSLMAGFLGLGVFAYLFLLWGQR